MRKKPQNYYRVFALLPLRCGSCVHNVRVRSERLSEAEAQSRRREILMAHPAATVRIQKTDESGRAQLLSNTTVAVRPARSVPRPLPSKIY